MQKHIIIFFYFFFKSLTVTDVLGSEDVHIAYTITVDTTDSFIDPEPGTNAFAQTLDGNFILRDSNWNWISVLPTKCPTHAPHVTTLRPSTNPIFHQMTVQVQLSLQVRSPLFFFSVK